MCKYVLTLILIFCILVLIYIVYKEENMFLLFKQLLKNLQSNVSLFAKNSTETILNSNLFNNDLGIILNKMVQNNKINLK
jgi:hypothetical protein